MPKTWHDVRPYFERGAVAHIATLLPDGSPHSVPVWVGVEGQDVAIFTEIGTRKDKNLSADPRVAISITHPDNPLDSAFIRGRAVRRVEGDEVMPIVDRIAYLYTGRPYDLREGFVVFLVRPEAVWSQDYSAD
jgi:PPOX class probable F420-dependent enzyme